MSDWYVWEQVEGRITLLKLRGDDWEATVRPGERLSFGRSGEPDGINPDGINDDRINPDRIKDVALSDDESLHRRCGLITVDESGWELHNTGRWLQLRVVGVDRFGIDQLLPGQVARVPWLTARVQVHAGSRCYEFTASYDGALTTRDVTPSIDSDHAAEIDDEHLTVVPVRVDRRSGYFRALVALCEPQLVDPACGEVATDLQISRRLNQLDIESGRITGKTVERRLAHCRERFGLRDRLDGRSVAGLEQRDPRRALVEAALLSGIVTAEDLAALAVADQTA